MKKTRLMIAAAVMAFVALLSGCRKDLIENSAQPFVSNGNLIKGSDGTTVVANRGIVHYHFQTLPQASTNPMQWSTASMNAVQLLFDGTFVSEPAPSPMSADTLIHQTVGLGVLADLGFVRPRVGTFRDIIFRVKMGLVGSTNAIVLTGSYNAGGYLYPVRLIVDQDVFLIGQWPAETKIVAPATHEFIALLQMNLDNLTAGIDPDLFKQAIDGITPGTEILISSQSNPQLYQHIYQNLLSKDELQVRLQ